MLTYNRGQWSEDTGIGDADLTMHNDQITGAGFDGAYPEWQFGNKYCLQVSVYVNDAESSRYRYCVLWDTVNRFEWFLVTDFPSLIQVLNELIPLVNTAMKTERYEHLEEEHQWKAKDRRRETGERDFCSHL